VEAQLVAVTVVAGNVDVDTGVGVALGLLELDGDDATAVHRGSERPLVEDAGRWREVLDRRGREIDSWGPPPASSSRKGSSIDAPHAIVQALKAQPEEVTVVAVGPLTNIALALRLEPSVAKLVSQIVVMGGSLGAAEPFNELNFGYDPEAAAIVLSSGARVVVVPLDVTRQACLTIEQNRPLAAANDPLVSFLGRAAEPWIRWVVQTRHQDGCFLHDAVAAAVSVSPWLCRTELRRARVELSGTLTRGKLVAWDPECPLLLTPPRESVGSVEVVVELNVDAFADMFFSRLLARG
jgi:inosine-uridine nucleoside N-ribohydrolase